MPAVPLIFILSYDPLLTQIASLPNVLPYAFADDLALAGKNV